MPAEFIYEFGLFLAKFTTVLLALVGVLAVVLLLVLRARSSGDEHLDIKNINQHYEQMKLMLESAILSKKDFKKNVKELKTAHRKQDSEEQGSKRVFVLDFRGDIRASEVASLREEISSLLTVATEEDEVLVRVESGGGTVHGYGLAASQLKRVRDRNIRLTVSVDKVAASGGYMMACVANHIIAAPFAIIGSIGVLAQLPNFNRLLKKHDIDFEQFSAGKYKRTVTMFGENTEEDREKLREELEETHVLFKEFIKNNRAGVDIENVATGEHWFGTKAMELGLVDEIITSDDYLGRLADTANLYSIEYVRKKPVIEKLFSSTVKLFSDETY